MARIEQRREDLFAEATAYEVRAELSLPDFAEMVFVGFRADGAGSLYFGESPVYHFNRHGELRRAFADDRLWKSDRGRIASLTRNRSDAASELARHDLTEPEQTEFLTRCESSLKVLFQQLAAGNARVARQYPLNVDLLTRIANWLQRLTPVRVAAAPHVTR